MQKPLRRLEFHGGRIYFGWITLALAQMLGEPTARAALTTAWAALNWRVLFNSETNL